MYAGKFLCIGQQPLHLCLRAAVAELEVVQHGIVLLGKALIGVLDGGHVSAHLVGVVGHVHHGHVGQLRSGVGILAHAGQQTGGKAGGLLHVFVGGQTHRPVRLCSVGLDRISALFEQGLHAADALLQCAAKVQGIRDHLADARSSDHLFQGAHQLCAQQRTGAFTGRGCLAAHDMADAALNALGRGHDLDISLCQLNAVCHLVHLLLRRASPPQIPPGCQNSVRPKRCRGQHPAQAAASQRT